MNSFNEIYLLDLHGNSLKKEKCPDGSKDENVFDIRQGTAIALFIKTKDTNSEESKKVFHSELWGMRKEKYDWLSNNDINSTKWREITPKSEFYFFVPRDERLLNSYQDFPKVTWIFPSHSLGFQTHRDAFVVDFNRELLKRRIRMFRDPKLPDEIIREAFKLKETRAWKLEQRRKRIKRDDNWEEKIVRCLYRPFDVRWIFYHRDAVDRGRQDIMRHILHRENLCLLVPRQIGTLEWSHVLVTKEIAESCVVSNKTREQNYNFPLYLYPDPADSDQKDLFSHLEKSKERKPNISEKIFSALSETYKTKPKPVSESPVYKRQKPFQKISRIRQVSCGSASYACLCVARRQAIT